MQVRRAKRDGDTRRRRARGVLGCNTDVCSPPQAATLHEGVPQVIEKAEAHEGPLRCTAGAGRRRGALRMWLVSQVRSGQVYYSAKV